MEAETAKLYNCESGKTVTIIAAPGSESTSSFDRDVPRIRTASTVSRGAEEIERRYKMWLRAETVGLSVVIVVVWGLLLLPVIFYYLPNVSKAIYSIKKRINRLMWIAPGEPYIG